MTAKNNRRVGVGNPSIHQDKFRKKTMQALKDEGRGFTHNIILFHLGVREP